MGPSHRAPRWACDGTRTQLVIFEAHFKVQRVRVIPRLGVHSSVQECIDLPENRYTANQAFALLVHHHSCE